MILLILNLILSVGNAFFTLLGVPTILPVVQNLLNSSQTSGIVSTFHSWLSWVFYFIPVNLVIVLVGATICFWILRVFFSLFRVITDLL